MPDEEKVDPVVLVNVIEDAFKTDDEPTHKKGDRIISIYDGASAEIQDVIDDVFITLCGYSVSTLKSMAIESSQE